MAPWVTQNLGKKITMVFPDYAFGYDHRDFFTEAVKAQGGEVIAQIAIPPTETTLPAICRRFRLKQRCCIMSWSARRF